MPHSSVGSPPARRSSSPTARGCWVDGAVVATQRDRLVVDVRSVVEEARPQPTLTVVQALPKGERADLAVETLTEVGVDRIVPWSATRSVTRWRDERGAKAWERWRTTAREAAKQSRRTWWPQVEPLAGTDDVVGLLAGAVLALVLHEEAAVPIADLVAPAAGDVVLVVGPEGGVAPEELAAFEAAGAQAVPARADRAANVHRRRRGGRRPAGGHGPVACYRTVNGLLSIHVFEPSIVEISYAFATY